MRIINSGRCTVGADDCLACGLLNLMQWYWDPQKTAQSDAAMNAAHNNLWNRCLRVFWGQQSASNQGIGPVDNNEEYHPESFLLHFLSAMQRQLEAIPGYVLISYHNEKANGISEYQTFLSLFTIHTVRRWNCTKGCAWTSNPEQWEQSLYLPITVQDLTGRSSQTSIAAGINRGLERRAQSSTPGGSKRRCHKCGNIASPRVDIVNFPEVLILIRNSEHVKTTRPDIPYTNDQLYMQYWTTNRDKSETERAEECKGRKIDAADILYTSLARDYKLIAGTAERVIDGNRSKSVAFARAPTEEPDLWWFMDDEQVDRVPGLEQLDRLQRRWDGRGSKIQDNVFPEVFIFRRTDDAGWEQEYKTTETGTIELSAPLDHIAKLRELRGRVVTEIFTQPVGEGLLKFKLTLAPADPEPNDSIPFSLELGYEYKGMSWRIDTKRTEGRLVPNVPGNRTPVDRRSTPIAEHNMVRYAQRMKGPATGTDIGPSGAGQVVRFQQP